MRRWIGLAAMAALGLWAGGCAEAPCAEQHGDRAKLDFVVKDMDGRDVSLASFKGRPMILNFWATWCGPCKEEIPTLVDLVQKYKAKDLVVLGVSVDDKPDELKKFAADLKMNYPVLVGLGHDDLLEAYDAQLAIPVSWFVNACGFVSVKHQGIGSRDWFEQQVHALF